MEALLPDRTSRSYMTALDVVRSTRMIGSLVWVLTITVMAVASVLVK